MKLVEGDFKRHSNAVYAPSEAWVQDGTLAHNIVFNRKFDSKRLAEVISMCALSDEFEENSYISTTVRLS